MGMWHMYLCRSENSMGELILFTLLFLGGGGLADLAAIVLPTEPSLLTK